jgi:hypothetical protein
MLRGVGVGWVSMALYALVYRQYPAAADIRFAIPHFWVANIGAEGRHLHSDGAHALAGIHRDLGFLNHDPWHANVHRHREMTAEELTAFIASHSKRVKTKN